PTSAASSDGRRPFGPGYRSTAKCAGTRSLKPTWWASRTIRRCTASDGHRTSAPLNAGAGVVAVELIIKLLYYIVGSWYSAFTTAPHRSERTPPWPRHP